MFGPQPEPQPELQPDRSGLYINSIDVMQTAAVPTAAVCLGHYTICCCIAHQTGGELSIIQVMQLKEAWLDDRSSHVA